MPKKLYKNLRLREFLRKIKLKKILYHLRKTKQRIYELNVCYFDRVDRLTINPDRVNVDAWAIRANSHGDPLLKPVDQAQIPNRSSIRSRSYLLLHWALLVCNKIGWNSQSNRLLITLLHNRTLSRSNDLDGQWHSEPDHDGRESKGRNRDLYAETR